MRNLIDRVFNFFDRRTEREKQEQIELIEAIHKLQETHDVWVSGRGAVHCRPKKTNNKGEKNV
jgi:hypothetical protein